MKYNPPLEGLTAKSSPPAKGQYPQGQGVSYLPELPLKPQVSGLKPQDTSLHSYIPTFPNPSIPTFLHPYIRTFLHSYIPKSLSPSLPANSLSYKTVTGKAVFFVSRGTASEVIQTTIPSPIFLLNFDNTEKCRVHSFLADPLFLISIG